VRGFEAPRASDSGGAVVVGQLNHEDPAKGIGNAVSSPYHSKLSQRNGSASDGPVDKIIRQARFGYRCGLATFVF
jgi:hypothetical protein